MDVSSVLIQFSDVAKLSPVGSCEIEGVPKEKVQSEQWEAPHLSPLLAHLSSFLLTSPSATNSWGDFNQSPSAAALLNSEGSLESEAV